jgi:hypothetical protein
VHTQITNWADASKFILAGNATFTLVSKKTGQRFTYKVRHASDYDPTTSPYRQGKVMAFVSVLTGSDNENSYSYLGVFKMGAGYCYGAKSALGGDSPSAKAFAWFHRAMYTQATMESGSVPEAVEFWHEGKCCRCGRKLTVPSSIASGMGPECATKTGFTAQAA